MGTVGEAELDSKFPLRFPPEGPFVTLLEALTWIGFRSAMDRDSLARAIDEQTSGSLGVQLSLADAMAKLATLASGGQIALVGKYIESHATNEDNADTEVIEPLRFVDFAQFDIVYDGLRYGTGLAWTEDGSVTTRSRQKRRDAYHCVKVNRADLMKQFPDTLEREIPATGRSIISAERKCREWLRKAFAADVGRKRPKSSFPI
jgi:hypothetical protein